MLDVVLINLIAAGIERICRPVSDGRRADGGRAAGTAYDREQLIRQLSAVEPDKTGRLISNVVERVWQNCQAVGLPAELAEPHLAVLPEILNKSYVRAADRAIFLGYDVKTSKNGVAELSRRIIASCELDCKAGGLDETVLLYLLESLLQALFTSRHLIQEIQPALAGLLSGHTEAEAAASSESAAVTLAKIKRADALGIPVPLLDVITVSLINQTRSVDLRQDDLIAIASDACELIEVFERLAVIVPVQSEPLEPLPGLFRAGKTGDCDRLLALAEDEIIKSSISTTAHVGGHAPIAIELRNARAQLAALESHYTKAARHCGFAQRYVPSRDNEQLWQLARREAHFYELAAFRGEDRQGLEHAARTCTNVLATIAEGPPSLTRADIQICLGHVLILLGEREGQSGRFQLAVQLLADAHGFLEGTQQSSGLLARAAVLRATALVRLGELLGDGGLVEQGAHMYQAVIETSAANGGRLVDQFEGDELLEPVLGLRPRLALAMISFAGLELAPGLYEPAISNLETELPEIAGHHTAYNRSGFDRFILVARCHQALAGWYARKGDSAAAEENRAEVARYCEAVAIDDLLSAHGPAEARPSVLAATN